MDTGDEKVSGVDRKEMFSHLVPEVFVHDESDPMRTEAAIDACLEIEKSRITVQPYDRELFEGVLRGTVSNEKNKGKTSTVVLVRDPKDNSIFGFMHAIPADNVYSDGVKHKHTWHPELLTLPGIEIDKEAYIEGAAFRKSGTGALKRTMQMLEDTLYDKGYRTIAGDFNEENGFAENVKKNNLGRILTTKPHELHGKQVFMRMTLNPPGSPHVNLPK